MTIETEDNIQAISTRYHRKERHKKGERGNAGYWVNNDIVCHPDLEKPCIKLGYCAYGQLVEAYPIGTKNTKLSCCPENGSLACWGHDCPVHYTAEFVECDAYGNKAEQESIVGGKNGN